MTSEAMSILVRLREFANGADGQSEIGDIAKELYGGCEKSHESHAGRTYKERHKLVAQKSYQHVEALHSTKDDGRLEYM